EGWGEYQYGFEESYGYRAGKFVRDKDAVIAAALLCEATLYYKLKEGLSIIDVLDKIYRRFGYFIEDQVSITLKGIKGKEQMTQIMDMLRTAQISELGSIPIERTEDYELGIGRLPDGREYNLVLPKSNVLRFSFIGGGFAMARPSGTEPKIKFYFSVKSDKPELLEGKLNKVKEDLLSLVNRVLQSED
ncbi:MAG: phospho-sugar mutase, partial [Desulfitobacterium hafniense]|nr:phospho-sugar mutase [Desulfitobacterium hafniense]